MKRYKLSVESGNSTVFTTALQFTYEGYNFIMHKSLAGEFYNVSHMETGVLLASGLGRGNVTYLYSQSTSKDSSIGIRMLDNLINQFGMSIFNSVMAESFATHPRIN